MSTPACSPSCLEPAASRPPVRVRRRAVGLLVVLLTLVLGPLAVVAVLTMREAVTEHDRDLRLLTSGESRIGVVVASGRSTPEDAGSVAWSRVAVTVASGEPRTHDVEEAHAVGARVAMLVLPATGEADGAEAVARRVRQWPWSPWLVTGGVFLVFEVAAVVWVWRLMRRQR